MKLKLCIILTTLLVASAHAKVQKLTGKAFSKDGKLLYIEKHEIVISDEGNLEKSNVKYFLPERDAHFAELNLKASEFKRLPNFVFNDSRNGKMRDVKVISREEVKVKIREAGEEEIKEKSFSITPELINAYGLDSFIRERFSDLIKKDATADFKFLVPSRLASYDFKIVTEVVTENEIIIVAMISNWFIRMFAPEVKLTYSRDKKRLIRFEGQSRRADPKNKQDVIVEITYE